MNPSKEEIDKLEKLCRLWIDGTPCNTLEKEMFSLSWGHLRSLCIFLFKDYIPIEKAPEYCQIKKNGKESYDVRWRWSVVLKPEYRKDHG